LNEQLWSWAANRGCVLEDGQNGPEGMRESIPAVLHSLGERHLLVLQLGSQCCAGSSSGQQQDSRHGCVKTRR